MAMTTHYFKIAFRNLWKYKAQSLTGIFSLAFGLACFVPALYRMCYETSYDGFYPGAEHIYRVYAIEKQSGKMSEMVPEPLVWLLREQFPATEAAAFIPKRMLAAPGKHPISACVRCLQTIPFSVFSRRRLSVARHSARWKSFTI
jgi:hypothetical protein